MIRMDAALHRQLAARAQGQNLSLNRLCLQLLKNGMEKGGAEEPWRAVALPLVKPLKKHFGQNLLGVAVFGSQVQKTATSQSDLDLLVVLDDGVPIKRELYSWWDAHVKWTGPIQTVNPHFVHLPGDPSKAGGFWLEVALHREILFEKGQKLSAALSEMLKPIQEGKVVRLFSNGHPYWVKEAS